MGIHKVKVLNKGYKPTERLFISPKGNFLIENFDVDTDIQNISDEGGYDSNLDRYNNPRCSNNIFTEFSLENHEGIVHEGCWNGCKYIVLKSGSDEGCYCYTFFYFDGKEVKYYVPVQGNPVNPKTMDEIKGYFNEDDRDWYIQNKICDTDADFDSLEDCDEIWEYLEADLDECIKEFESILTTNPAACTNNNSNNKKEVKEELENKEKISNDEDISESNNKLGIDISTKIDVHVQRLLDKVQWLENDLVNIKKEIKELSKLGTPIQEDASTLNKILKAAQKNGTQVIGVPPGEGIVLGVDTDTMESSIRRIK